MSNDWHGELPDSWMLSPAKSLFRERREPSHTEDTHLTPSQSHGVLPQTEYTAITGNRVVQNIEGQNSMKHVEPDDFIIHLRSFQGGLEHSKLAGKVSTAYTVLSPMRGAVPSYYRWLLKSDAYIQVLRTTTNQLRDGQSIRFGDFTKVPLPAPPPAAQRAIADYLDRETAQIDTLIAEQQRLIALLRERRVALQATAFAPWVERDAGSRLKHAIVGSRQGWSPDCYGWPADGVGVWAVLKAGAANGGIFRPHENKELPDDLAPRPETVVREGDVIVSRANTRDLVGSAAVVVGEFPKLQLCDKLYALEVERATAIPDFVAGALGHPASRGRIELAASGSSPSMQNVSKTDILNLPLDLPDLDTQRSVVKRLQRDVRRVDALTREAERLIELARERRSALITAAVTGQIDTQRMVGEAS